MVVFPAVELTQIKDYRALLPVDSVLQGQYSLKQRIGLKDFIFNDGLGSLIQNEGIVKVVERSRVVESILTPDISQSGFGGEVNLGPEGLLDFLNFVAHRIHSECNSAYRP